MNETSPEQNNFRSYAANLAPSYILGASGVIAGVAGGMLIRSEHLPLAIACNVLAAASCVGGIALAYSAGKKAGAESSRPADKQ